MNFKILQLYVSKVKTYVNAIMEMRIVKLHEESEYRILTSEDNQITLSIFSRVEPCAKPLLANKSISRTTSSLPKLQGMLVLRVDPLHPHL